MTHACIICAAHPRMFADKGTALDIMYFRCPEFSNRAYSHSRRKDDGEPENHLVTDSGLPAPGAQGKLFKE